jgi:hypothetical protein
VDAFVGQFVVYAQENLDTIFLVTRIGCGLAGFKDEDIAPLFRNAPHNCILPVQWRPWLKNAERWHDEGVVIHTVSG